MFCQNIALAAQSYSKYGLEIARVVSHYTSPEMLLNIKNHYTTISFVALPFFILFSYLLELLAARLSFNRLIVR